MELTWDDVDRIAEALILAYPDVDPMELSVQKLRSMITELPDFDDDAGAPDEAQLEAIQMAWYDLIG